MAAPSTAEQNDRAVFDLSLRGIHAGTLSVSGAIEGGRYAVAGVLQSGGLLALVRKVRYDARSQGRYTGGRFTPARYEEDADTGKRKSQSVMEYRSGVPQVKVYNPPKPPRDGDLDPATQGGTVDPLTALYAALRDVPAQSACRLKLTLFDGRRRSQVALGEPKKNGDGGVSCAGEYRRLAGFSANDMAEKSRFSFVLRYEPTGGGKLRVRDISMDTLYGKGRLTRR
ncbi:DUF3108 domain-containing protein [Albidovulum aquaemixtae]|nr:DUF3108 domain-containing protein [Defluviimonas aquaemixtae]